MAKVYAYLTRIVPVLSLLAASLLLLWAFVISNWRGNAHGQRNGVSTVSQLVLSAYTVFLHILSVMFPARVWWAMGDVIKKMQDAANLTKWPKRRKTRVVKGDKGSQTYSTPTFVIILPAYKEEVATMEETLSVLASHPHARWSYHIYLAMEQKEEGAATKAERLLETFSKSFHRMSYTVHPSNLPGEAQGKSSNENWAATQALLHYPDAVKNDVIVTVMDADTHLSQRYFAQVAKHHLEHSDSNQETIYVPPIVFDRNLDKVPLPVRTADLMWNGAGISSLYPGSAICIPTSVYSLPMTLIDKVGGWDTDPGSIGEDMHMYLKCFFALSGNLKAKVIYSAASQCNICSDKEGIEGFCDGLKARYKQALRHMWGTLDTGYAIRQTVCITSTNSRAHWARIQPSWTVAELAGYLGETALATMSTVCSTNWAALGSKMSISKPTVARHTAVPTSAVRPMHFLNISTVFLRLFEAHFLPLHLSLILSVSGIYENFSGLAFPPHFAAALTFCGYCRWIGWVLVIAFFYRYERYVRLCARLRKEEMQRAGLLNPENEDEGFCDKVFKIFGVVEAGTFPFGGFVFGAFPACQAILSHLFTERLVYHVSLKPQLGVRVKEKVQEVVERSTTMARPATPKTKKCASEVWKKQALEKIDRVATGMRYRPVQTED